MQSPIVGKLILFFVGSLAWIYSIQPYWMRETWGNLLGACFRVLKVRSQVVHQNQGIAFSESQHPISPQRSRELYRDAYRHLGKLILEVLMVLAPFNSFKRYVLRHADLHGLEYLREAQKRGKGVIYLASHVGNWEVMSATSTLMAQSEVLLVTKRLKPAWLHDAIERGRASYGVKATYEPRTLRDVLAALKRNGTVGFILDQYAGAPVGVRVPVFGVPVGTMTAVATLAKRTGATVLPVLNYRVGRGRWHVEIRPPVEWKESSDAPFEIADNTARYAAVIERDIYAHPDQWLWIHRRFKGDMSPLREGEWRLGRVRT